MIKLVLLIGIIYGIFWITSPEGKAYTDSVSATVTQKGVRGLMETTWCGERGCDPTSGSPDKDVSPDPANKSKR